MLEHTAHPWWDDENGNGFCRERWDLWKDRLRNIAEVSDVEVSTKELARQAIAEMSRVELL